MSKVIVTGVTGQIGSQMVDYLLRNTDCEILGTVRRLSVNNHDNIEGVLNERFSLVEMDLSDAHSILSLIEREKPDYFINFAANSFVGTSWTYPVQHMEINAIGVLHQLEAIRKYSPHTRYLNLGSSEEFGDVEESPQNEKTELRPRSPYGASKVAARFLTKVYRDSYDLYALQVWNFNSEGVKRGKEFVTRKISIGVAAAKKALESPTSFGLKKEIEPIKLGNLSSRRDWQDSIDVCDGIWRILNQENYRAELRGLSGKNLIKNLKEYVLSSGKTHSIRDFVKEAFVCAGIKGKWVGAGLDEKYTLEDGAILVEVSADFFRPAEVDLLLGDSKLIRQELGWNPKVHFKELVSRMVNNDIRLLNGK